ncbi:MAG: hypothetical protein SPK06_00095, partial [Kiritimatiellia bacterium]|nr:hypothetical protein [Kiritimatiellia bacterium]
AGGRAWQAVFPSLRLKVIDSPSRSDYNAGIMNRNFIAPIGLLVATVAALAAVAQEEIAEVKLTAAERKMHEFVEQESAYVSALLQARLADIADRVIAEGIRKYPASAPSFKAAQTQVKLSQGKLKEVLAEIDASADKNSAEAWGSRLVVASYYYANRQYVEADRLYKAFFKQFPKPTGEIVRIYQMAAYTYVGLLKLSNREKEAVPIYKLLLACPMDPDAKRTIQAEAATLMVRLAEEAPKAERETYLKPAEQIVKSLFWAQDIAYGQAIVLYASIKMIRTGDPKAAQAVLDQYMDVLKQIHEQIKEVDPKGTEGLLRQSPMPSCRYLLGVMYEKEADKEIAKGSDADDAKIKDLYLGARGKNGKRNAAGAYNHFINVFVNYPESQYAVAAGEHAERIRGIIKERYKTELKANINDEQMRKVRQQQFASARILFTENKFKEAAELNLTVLSGFPEMPESIPALQDTIQCYIELASGEVGPERQMNLLYADTLVGYAAERFSGNPRLKELAGNLVRKAADLYEANGFKDNKEEALELFVRCFPDHSSSSYLASQQAGKLFDAKQWDEALEKYAQIARNYAGKPVALDALNRIVTIWEKKGDDVRRDEALKAYIAELDKLERPGMRLALAQYRLAEGQRIRAVGMNRLAESLREAKAAPAASAGAAASASGNPTSGTASGATANLPATPAAAAKEAIALFVRAIKGYGAIAAELAKPKSRCVSGSDDPAKVAELREACLFLPALCYTQMKLDETRTAKFRAAAVGQFAKCVEQFPKGALAPKALLQIGTIQTTLGQAKEAQATLDRLSKEYPDSQEAKNSKPMLAAALIEMGQRGPGVALYREMLETAGGKYTPEQYFTASQTMKGAREYDLAIQAAQKAIASAKKGSPIVPNALLEVARNQVLLKRFGEAHRSLDEFLKVYGKTELSLDANQLMIDVIAAEIADEGDDEKREALMKQAVAVLRTLKQYRNSEEDAIEYDLQSGNLLKGKMEAELKLDRKAAAEISRGKAIVAYLGITQRKHKSSPRVDAALEEAYRQMLPLMAEAKSWEDIRTSAEHYLQLFPKGRYATDVRQHLQAANIELGPSKSKEAGGDVSGAAGGVD